MSYNIFLGIHSQDPAQIAALYNGSTPYNSDYTSPYLQSSTANGMYFFIQYFPKISRNLIQFKRPLFFINFWFYIFKIFFLHFFKTFLFTFFLKLFF